MHTPAAHPPSTGSRQHPVPPELVYSRRLSVSVSVSVSVCLYMSCPPLSHTLSSIAVCLLERVQLSFASGSQSPQSQKTVTQL